LNFSVGSVKVIGIGHSSGFSSGTFSGTLGFGGIRDISEERVRSCSHEDRVFKDKPDDIFFTWGEREGSSIFIVIERGWGVILIIIIDEFHDMEIFGQQVVSFSEEGVGQVEDIHFFESLDDGTGFSLIKYGDNGLLFEGSLDTFMDNLEFGVEFGTHDSVFTRSME
jgi:hypothetical protein